MTGAKGPTTLWEQEFDGFKAEVLSQVVSRSSLWASHSGRR